MQSNVNIIRQRMKVEQTKKKSDENKQLLRASGG